MMKKRFIFIRNRIYQKVPTENARFFLLTLQKAKNVEANPVIMGNTQGHYGKRVAVRVLSPKSEASLLPWYRIPF